MLKNKAAIDHIDNHSSTQKKMLVVDVRRRVWQSVGGAHGNPVNITLCFLPPASKSELWLNLKTG
jgi:hypothetical protein